MADDTEKSLFRNALDTGTSAIVNGAFPQLSNIIRGIAYRNEKDKEEDQDKKSTSAERRSSGSSNLGSAEIQIIDEGFNEIHNDLLITNIILTSTLEQATKTHALLEKFFIGGGIGVGGNGGNNLGGGGGGNQNNNQNQGNNSTYNKFGPLAKTGSALGMIANMLPQDGEFPVIHGDDPISKFIQNSGKQLFPSPFGGDKQDTVFFNKNKGNDEESSTAVATQTAITKLTETIEIQKQGLEKILKEIDEMQKRGEDTTKLQNYALKVQQQVEELQDKRQEDIKNLGKISNIPKVDELPEATFLRNSTANAIPMNPALKYQSKDNPYNRPPQPTYGSGTPHAGQNQTATQDLSNRMSGVSANQPANVAKGALAKNQKIAYDEFKSLGYSDQAARVAVAGLSGEALSNPGDVHADPSRSNPNQKAHGIASWDDSRSERIRQQFGKMPNEMSLPEQIKALDWEQKNYYKDTYGALHNDQMSPLQQMQSFVGKFERPANVGGEVNKRMGLYNGTSHLSSADANVQHPGPEGSGSGTGPQSNETGDQVVNRLKNMKDAGLVSGDQCVSLAAASVGLKPGQWNVHNWDMSHSATPGSLPIGTPVATHMDDQRNQSDRYAGGGSGTPGANKDHAGVISGYKYDNKGNPTGMYLAEQYTGSHGVKNTFYPFGGGANEKNALNYSPIYGPDGKPLGGMNNPLYRQHLEEVNKSKLDDAAKLHADLTPAVPNHKDISLLKSDEQLFGKGYDPAKGKDISLLKAVDDKYGINPRHNESAANINHMGIQNAVEDKKNKTASHTIVNQKFSEDRGSKEPKQASTKTKGDAGQTATSDERVKKLFSNYSGVGHN
ncbi:MAG: phage tail tip lysozyme [Nitrospiria bacterium]